MKEVVTGLHVETGEEIDKRQVWVKKSSVLILIQRLSSKNKNMFHDLKLPFKSKIWLMVPFSVTDHKGSNVNKEKKKGESAQV